MTCAREWLVQLLSNFRTKMVVSCDLLSATAMADLVASSSSPCYSPHAASSRAAASLPQGRSSSSCLPPLCHTSPRSVSGHFCSQTGFLLGSLRLRLPRGASSSSSTRPSRRAIRSALGEGPLPSEVVYQGIYGPWKVESDDVREVILYRAGLVTSAATFVAAASTAVLPEDSPISAALKGSYDILYALGAGGLGLSLGLIHIYVTPIKRTLQLLWLVGALGSLGLAVNFAAPEGQGLVSFVLDHPAAVWGVGPLFASLTGLVFKEGLCYGKLEAAALFFIIPSLLLGHLSGVTDRNVELGLLAAWTTLFAVFAARKFTQPIKDDIGDKSVFIFNALPEAEKEALLSRLQATGQNTKRD